MHKLSIRAISNRNMTLISGNCHFEFPISGLGKRASRSALALGLQELTKSLWSRDKHPPMPPSRSRGLKEEQLCLKGCALLPVSLDQRSSDQHMENVFSPHPFAKTQLNLVMERPNQDQIDGHILLGHGISGYVIALDGNYVQKIFSSSGNPFLDEAKEKRPSHR